MTMHVVSTVDPDHPDDGEMDVYLHNLHVIGTPLGMPEPIIEILRIAGRVSYLPRNIQWNVFVKEVRLTVSSLLVLDHSTVDPLYPYLVHDPK